MKEIIILKQEGKIGKKKSNCEGKGKNYCNKTKEYE